jgi:hypothetical protein
MDYAGIAAIPLAETRLVFAVCESGFMQSEKRPEHGVGNAQSHIALQRATLEPVAITVAGFSAKSSRGAIRTPLEISGGDIVADLGKSMGPTPG